MIKMPKFLRKMIQSDAYINKSNPDYESTNEKVTNYLEIFYPGQMEYDPTGRMKEPNYDMTETEFIEARNELDHDLEEAIAEIEAEMEENGIIIDVSQYIELEESIPVKVLHPDGRIDIDYLEVYDIDLPDDNLEPDDDDEEDSEDDQIIYVWSEGGECDFCASMAGTILDGPGDVGAHPNCGCTAVPMTKEEYEELYGKPDPEKQKKYEDLKAKKMEWGASKTYSYKQTYTNELKKEEEMKNGEKELEIRKQDDQGNGEYGKSRDGGIREHTGIDIISKPGAPVYALKDGKYMHEHRPYTNDPNYNGLNIKDSVGNINLYFYVTPAIVPGTNVNQGDLIGYTQNIADKYPGITSHYHFEVRTPEWTRENRETINPKEYLDGFTFK
ncbi:MAG: peptidoglycan DD-metalloendopeptidase family protein [Alphaproteobacteria bacterium]|nr:peptidoglycan DD-metalloendopeptidase family protein [Alphaproteobacteria bacterium]